MLFYLFKHYLDVYITDTALKVSISLYCFLTSVCHGVETISPGCEVRASPMLSFSCVVSVFPDQLIIVLCVLYVSNVPSGFI